MPSPFCNRSSAISPQTPIAPTAAAPLPAGIPDLPRDTRQSWRKACSRAGNAAHPRPAVADDKRALCIRNKVDCTGYGNHRARFGRKCLDESHRRIKRFLRYDIRRIRIDPFVVPEPEASVLISEMLPRMTVKRISSISLHAVSVRSLDAPRANRIEHDRPAERICLFPGEKHALHHGVQCADVDI